MEIDGRVELSGQGGWHPETVSGQLGTASAVYIEHPESQEPSAKKCDHRSYPFWSPELIHPQGCTPNFRLWSNEHHDSTIVREGQISHSHGQELPCCP